MTNIEMDDVLSSIRRLVSKDSDKKPETVVVTNDRFVLTPALRVPDDILSAPQSTETDELAGLLSAAADAALAPKGDETPEIPAKPEPISPEFEAMELAWKAELARVAATRVEADGTGDTPDSSADVTAQSLELQIAELEEAVSHSQEEWEPDGSEPEAKQLPKRHIFEIVDNTKTTPDAAKLGETPEDLPVFSHTAPRPKPYLLSEIVTPEPEPETIIEPDTPVKSGASLSGSANVVDSDDVFLDVEALRKMITEVLREELRGKLGESITRNVRRMMQQEIATAIGENLDDDELT